MERPSQSKILELMTQHRGVRAKTQEYAEWQSYFEIYNQDPNNSKIGMGCLPCYHKVYEYMRKQPKEMTEEEYISKLEAETNLKLGKDFGFIMGTTTPFAGDRGFHSANRHSGYIVWKRQADAEGKSATVELRTQGLSFQETVEFLKTPNEDIIKSFTDKGFAVIDHTGEVL